MSQMKPPTDRAALLGDLIGSRAAADRRALHHTLSAALGRVQELVPTDDPPRITVGDEFQASYPSVGEALHAAFLLRLDLLPEVDLRFGIGWGAVTVLDARSRTQDGPAWWCARDAIEATKHAEGQAARRRLRTTYRSADDEHSAAAAVNAALLCRDHLLGSMDQRSLRILGGLVAGRSKVDLAAAEGISASAVSQRSARDGIDVVLAASELLRALP